MMSGSFGRAFSVLALVCVVLVGWSFAYPSLATAEPGGEKPTIVLVHGAWADASSWNGEVEALAYQGYVVRTVSNGRTCLPMRSMNASKSVSAVGWNTIASAPASTHRAAPAAISSAVP
jgi:hypothetical protein